jgi:hypothetical protein
MNAAQLAIETRRAPALAELRARFEQQEQVVRAAPPFQYEPAKGSKLKGLQYERRVGRILAGICKESNWILWEHQWFKYSCNGKSFYFQPDFIIEKSDKEGIIAEVKLTHVDTREQREKYMRCLKLFGLNCFSITIVRNLTPSVAANLIVDEFSKIQPDSVWHLWA